MTKKWQRTISLNKKERIAVAELIRDRPGKILILKLNNLTKFFNASIEVLNYADLGRRDSCKDKYSLKELAEAYQNENDDYLVNFWPCLEVFARRFLDKDKNSKSVSLHCVQIKLALCFVGELYIQQSCYNKDKSPYYDKRKESVYWTIIEKLFEDLNSKRQVQTYSQAKLKKMAEKKVNKDVELDYSYGKALQRNEKNQAEILTKSLNTELVKNKHPSILNLFQVGLGDNLYTNNYVQSYNVVKKVGEREQQVKLYILPSIIKSNELFIAHNLRKTV